MEQRRDNSRYSNKKPTRGLWKLNTSSWKKEFCKVVGQMEWETFLHMMEFRHLSPHVNSWDNSAGKEALDNAWRRFWCKKKGLMCNIPLPDPDLYNDVVDWDAEVNPELCRDLENFRVVCHTEEQNNAPVVDYPLPSYQNIMPTGWADVDGNLYPVPVYTPAWPHEGPSWVPPSVSPTFGWHYPTPGGGWNNNYGWSYNTNYMGPPELWNYNNVATTSNSHAFGPGYTTWRAQADGGQRNQTGKQSADKLQDKRTQAK